MKKYVKSGYEETVGLKSTYDKICDYIYEDLVYGDLYTAMDIHSRIPEYDPDWCEEEYNPKTDKQLSNAARAYARACADILLANK